MNTRRIILSGLAALFVSVAHAYVVYTDFADISTNGIGVNSQPLNSLAIDLGFNGSSASVAAEHEALSTYDFIVYEFSLSGREFGSGFNYQSYMTGSGSGQAMNVPFGTVLGDESNRWGNSTDYGFITAGTSGYFGVRMDNSPVNNHGPFTYTYGWIGFTRNSDGSFTLHDAAYETSGASIQAGAIPEPSAFAAIGGAIVLGCAALRRRRQA